MRINSINQAYAFSAKIPYIKGAKNLRKMLNKALYLKMLKT